jgi:hypothetical protein
MDMPGDHLVTWRQLAGNGRLADALTAGEVNGWDAFPLPPRELARLFPDL